MLRHAISHARLMRESTDRVEAALRSSDGGEQLIARRILESAVIWEQWESEHSSLMRQLANCGMLPAQVAALKQTTLRLLHGKALFQYLRHRRSCGERRGHGHRALSSGPQLRDRHHRRARRVPAQGLQLSVREPFGQRGRARSRIPRSHAALRGALQRVFRSILQQSWSGATRSRNRERALLPLLKQQLHEYRLAILDPRGAQPFLQARSGAAPAHRRHAAPAPRQPGPRSRTLGALSASPLHCSASLRSFADGGVHW